MLAPNWPPATRRGCRLEGITQAIIHAALECESIAGDTQVPSSGDNAVVGREELAGQCERIPDANAELAVELSGEGEVSEGGVRNSTRNAAAFRADVRDREVGEKIVEPLLWGVDCK